MPGGGAHDALHDFIKAIPAEELTAWPSNRGTAYKDQNYRLDIQGTTTGSRNQNIQVQVNRETKIKTLKKVASRTVAKALPPTGGKPWSTEETRKALMENREL